MGLYDRPYWREDFGRPDRRRVFGGMPKPPSVVKWLLIANVTCLVLQLLPGGAMTANFAVIPLVWWQIWRYVTFQFLHAGLLHLFFNMLGLYFLGSILEGAWGAKRFVTFYLTCGAFAGLCHVVTTFAFNPGAVDVQLLGASGGVYAVVLAAAVLFPHIRVILFLFPVPIRFAAVLFIGIAVYNILSGIAAGRPGGGVSDAAHLGGAVAGAFWIWGLPRLRGTASKARVRRGRGAWRKKLESEADDEVEIDKILHKIHEHGIGSLTMREKRTLQQATRKQQEEEDKLYRS